MSIRPSIHSSIHASACHPPRPLTGVGQPLKCPGQPLRSLGQPLRGLSQCLRGLGQLLRGLGGDVRTYGRTDSPCILQDFVPSNNMQCDSEPLEIRLLALGHLVLRSFFCSHHSLLLLLPFPWLNGTSCRYNNVLTLRNVGTLTIIKTVACLSQ